MKKEEAKTGKTSRAVNILEIKTIWAIKQGQNTLAPHRPSLRTTAAHTKRDCGTRGYTYSISSKATLFCSD